jgi:hemerythrin-like domain-containing protein
VIKPEDLLRREPESASLDRPLDHLMACHRRIENRLNTLQRAAAAIESDPPAARAALESAFRFFETSGMQHTEDEERSLFPRLRPALSREDLEFLDALEHQHVQANALFPEVKRAIDGPPDIFRAKVARLVELYRDHIAAEDSLLQPLAQLHLSPQDVRSIAVEMKRRRGLPA